MNAVVLEKPHTFTRADRPEPARPGPGQALVKTHRVGVCGTDISGYLGKMPFLSYPRIMGHELGVEVLEIGPEVSNVAPGDRCSVEPYLNCGSCYPCSRNRGNCCERIQVLGVHTDGGLQEEFLLPAHKLHPSTGLSFDQLALVETLAIGCHAIQRMRPTPDDDVLVVGAGPIGLAVMQFVCLAGASLTVLDLNAQRLDFCRNTLGIRDTILHPGTEDAGTEIFKARQNRGYSIVFDATGNPTSMNQAPEYVAHSGSLVFVGIHKGLVSFPDPLFHSREMSLFASRNALPADFRQIIRQMQAGLIDTTPWITHRIHWLDLPASFEQFTRPENHVVKAMIELD